MCHRAEGRPDRRPPAGRRRGADCSGFTLIEVLVAFAMMATMLSVLYRSAVQTRAGAISFDARDEEDALALSVLAEFQARRDLPDGRYGGERDGHGWTLVAAPIDLADQLAKASARGTGRRDGQGWTMQRLVVRVATKGRPLESEALHLVRTIPEVEAR